MSNATSPRAIRETVHRLLEQWAMMVVEPLESGLSCFDPDKPMIISRVQYTGPSGGSFSVLVQEPFMRALLNNLVDEEGQNDQLLVDGAKELSNLISGNLLTELFGEEKAFSLQAPLVTVSDVATIHRGTWPNLVCLQADGCPVALSYASETEDG